MVYQYFHTYTANATELTVPKTVVLPERKKKDHIPQTHGRVQDSVHSIDVSCFINQSWIRHPMMKTG